MNTTPAQKQTRMMVQAAAAVCEEKKGQHTRILELDPVDSGLSDFFLVTSATNERQAVAIADEIELRLKHNFGAYANSVEGRRNGGWILLDYVDFVIHVFLSEKRAFYDIERLRKSARPLTPAEFDAELTAALKEKTRAVRGAKAAKAPAKKWQRPPRRSPPPQRRRLTQRQRKLQPQRPASQLPRRRPARSADRSLAAPAHAPLFLQIRCKGAHFVRSVRVSSHLTCIRQGIVEIDAW
ncbi:MAG: ribosome silencing factor [Terracidiphilus sp.]